jgi:hypothetical protein
MSQYVDTGTRTFIADAAIPQFARVVFENDSRVVVAGLTEVGCGIAMTAAFVAGDAIEVKLWNSGGTFKMRASEALTAAAILYTESDGEVQDTAQATSVPFAQALEAATNDGDIIECVLLPYRGAAVSSE